MDDNGFDAVVVEHPGSDVNERPFMEFTPGYVLRAIDELPKQGDRTPWRSTRTTCVTSGSSDVATSPTRVCGL